MFNLDDFLEHEAPRAARLHAEPADGSGLVVYEHAGLRWFSAGGVFVQSMTRTAAPAELVLPNHLTMIAALALGDTPRRVLNLGLGGGAFERFFAARLPAVEIVSVEPDHAVVELARRFFALDERQPVTHCTAQDYLAQDGSRFDFVLCDIFDGEYHPDCLFDSYFHEALAAHLSGGGRLALNLSPSDESELVEILAAMRHAFEHVALAPVADHGNLVVFAAQSALPDESARGTRAAELAGELAIEVTSLLPAIERLPSRREVLDAC